MGRGGEDEAGVVALYDRAAGVGGEDRVGTVTHSRNGGGVRAYVASFLEKAKERGIAPLFYLCI